jgi:hypothetical protein
MTQRMGTASAFTLAIVAGGLLFAGSAFAQQGNDLSPAKSNCASSSGCANYPTGDVSKSNPAAQPKNEAQNAAGDYSPAKSNCATPTGCANYPTGDVSKANPSSPSK